MRQEVDVLVIGGGVAGAVAAARLLALGHTVSLIYKSSGQSGYSSGAVDIADSQIDEVPGIVDPFERGRGWLKSAQGVRQKNAHHPYARFHEDLNLLPSAISLLAELASNVSLVGREDGYNHVLVTQLGTLKRSALVQKSLLFDACSLGEDACVGIVQISGLLGFDAKPVVDMLRWIGQMRKGPSFQVVPIPVSFGPKMGAWRSMMEAAHAFDDVQTQVNLIKALKQSLKDVLVKPDQFLFPAIMGFSNPISILQSIEVAIGSPCRELLAMPFSVPGARLSKALFSGLLERNVKLLNGKVSGYNLQQGRLCSVFAQDMKGEILEFAPKTVVLASGRVLGGGIVNDGTMRDSIFELPVWSDVGPVLDKFSLDMTQSSTEDAHTLFRVGLACDHLQRPLNRFGELFANNLYAAGSVMKGYDSAKEATGIGVAALLGFSAAEFASKDMRKN